MATFGRVKESSKKETYKEKRLRLRQERKEQRDRLREAKKAKNNLPEKYEVPGWPRRRSRNTRDYLTMAKNTMIIPVSYTHLTLPTTPYV